MNTLFNSIRVIQTDLQKTENILKFYAVQPSAGDWIFIIALFLLSVPLSWYTTKNYHYALASMVLAYSLIDDSFETVLNKQTNEVHVKKTKTGRVKWIRAAALDELINAEVVTVEARNGVSYRLELEFISSFGYYRLETADTTVLGEKNKAELELIAAEIRKFMGLKQLPKEFTEEHLRKTMPTSMKKEDRDDLRKQEKRELRKRKT